MRGNTIRMGFSVRCVRLFPWNVSDVNTRASLGGDSDCFDYRLANAFDTRQSMKICAYCTSHTEGKAVE